MDSKVLIFAGDVAPKRPDLDSIFCKTGEFLNSADLVFGQLEAVVSEIGSPACHSRLPLRIYPAAGDCLKRAGFDVMSFASNHTLDWGLDGYYRTIEVMRESGIAIVGVGDTIDEAREPVITELDDGTKVGFLAYCSILPQGYWALPDRPGVNPMRALTCAVPNEYDQPGTPVTLYTWPHPVDLKNMIADIQALRQKVDILVVSQHWGIHFTPAVIADYQRYVGRFAIDAGADIVVGHHSHILKGIEVYKGKVIAYSLANFATEGAAAYFEGERGLLNDSQHGDIRKLNEDFKNHPNRTMPFDSCKSILLKCIVRDRKIARVSFLPVWIDDDSFIPEILTAGNPLFDDVINYMSDITQSQEIEPHFFVEGNEAVIVEGGGSCGE